MIGIPGMYVLHAFVGNLIDFFSGKPIVLDVVHRFEKYNSNEGARQVGKGCWQTKNDCDCDNDANLD